MYVYSFHLVEVVPLVHACLCLVVECLRIHPITGYMQRIHQTMALRVACINPFRDGHQRNNCASSILEVNVVFVRKQMQLFRCLLFPFHILDDLPERVDLVAYSLPTDLRFSDPYALPVGHLGRQVYQLRT